MVTTVFALYFVLMCYVVLKNVFFKRKKMTWPPKAKPKVKTSSHQEFIEWSLLLRNTVMKKIMYTYVHRHAHRKHFALAV